MARKDYPLFAPVIRTLSVLLIGGLVPMLLAVQALHAADPPASPADQAVRFTGRYTESLVDEDRNGLAEFLKIIVEVDAAKAGKFYLPSTIARSSSGALIDRGSVVRYAYIGGTVNGIKLVAGRKYVAAYFLGYNIRTKGADGPYKVSVSVYSDDGIFQDKEEFTTAPYKSTDFQGFLLENISISDRGLDADADGLFESLEVEVKARVLANSTFSVDGTLSLGQRTPSYARVEANLQAGPQIIRLRFDGENIWRSGQDGPYDIYLSLFNRYCGKDIVHRTKSYKYSDFLPPAAIITGPIEDSPLDTNGNGLYEALIVTFKAKARVPGTYVISGSIYSKAGKHIQSAADVKFALSGEAREVVLKFNGSLIQKSGANGPYRVNLAIAKADGGSLMGTSYETRAYAYTDFETHPAALADTYSDQAVDINGDGFFEVLQISVGVTVAERGTYTVKGTLWDERSIFINEAKTEVLIEPGSHLVALDFDGGAIHRHGADGPYRLDWLHLERAGVSLDSNHGAYRTGEYRFERFRSADVLDGAFFADRVEDTDGDGLFEALIVTMEIVIIPDACGDYRITGQITGKNSQFITVISKDLYLGPGAHRIDLRFDGRTIYGRGADGPYEFFVSIDRAPFNVPGAPKDDGRYDRDDGKYITKPYEWHDFERPGIVRGTVTAAGKPVADISVWIGGVSGDFTDKDGKYRLIVTQSGTYKIQIVENQPSPIPGGEKLHLAPWDIVVDGRKAAVGSSVTLKITEGQEIVVDFISAAAAPKQRTEANGALLAGLSNWSRRLMDWLGLGSQHSRTA